MEELNKISDGTIWIDVTMLVNWSGRMTGIQRVEYNLAKRFAQQDNVKFCVFDKNRNILFEFDFKHIEYKIGNQQEDNVVVQQERILEYKAIARAKSLTKAGLSRVLPAKIKASAAKGYRQVISQIHDTPTNIIMSPDDKFLILSGDWSDHVFADYVAGLHKIKIVQVIYDMLPALYPGYFVPGMPKQFSDYMVRILSHSSAVLAISNSTKNDVVRFMLEYKLSPIPIEVFRLGDDFVKMRPKKPAAFMMNKGEYTLTVCTVESRKNHLLMFYAAREAVRRGVELPPMVIAGKRGWLVDDFFYLVENNPEISKKFIFIQPSDSELAWLYENCKFTIFPSFYEGWGLPVAESLFYNKFCLSSDASSMPEIAGDLIDYFSPNDPVALLDKMILYDTNSHLLTNKEIGIKNSYRSTSWDAVFARVRSLIEHI